MKKRYKLYGKNRKVFLEGLQRYRDRGVVIRVDGEEAEPADWMRILEIQADGSFYMGYYIVEEHNESQKPNVLEATLICEGTKEYLASEKEDVNRPEQHYVGILKEIRFDRVYNR